MCILGIFPNETTNHLETNQSQDLSLQEISDNSANTSQDINMSTQPNEKEGRQYGYFDNEAYIISQRNKQRIYQNFKLLNFNYKKNQEIKKQLLFQSRNSQPSFQPDISQSQNKNYLSKKYLSPKQTDDLIGKLNVQKQVYYQKRSLAKEKKERENLDKYSFQPDVYKSISRSKQYLLLKQKEELINQSTNFMDLKISLRKSVELDQKSLEKKIKLHEKFNQYQQILFTNQRQEPNQIIHKGYLYHTPQNQEYQKQIKGVDTSLERMQKGRVQREQLKLLQQKGYPYMGKKTEEYLEKSLDLSYQGQNINISNSEIDNKSPNQSFMDKQQQQSQHTTKNQKFKEIVQKNISNRKNQHIQKQSQNRQKQQDQQKKTTDKKPILYIDINLGANHNEHIEIYVGDQAHEVAKKFLKQHNLNKSLLSKLEAIISDQIKSLDIYMDYEEDNISEQMPSYEYGSPQILKSLFVQFYYLNLFNYFSLNIWLYLPQYYTTIYLFFQTTKVQTKLPIYKILLTLLNQLFKFLF